MMNCSFQAFCNQLNYIMNFHKVKTNSMTITIVCVYSLGIIHVAILLFQVEAQGSEFTCDPCPSGLDGDGQTCYDRNECQESNDTCSQECENTAGSFMYVRTHYGVF